MTFLAMCIFVSIETVFRAVERAETLWAAGELVGLLLEHSAVGAELEALVDLGLRVAVTEDDGHTMRLPAHQNVPVEVGQYPCSVPYK
jgi:hypothetical protein